jgi:hypothetical protein
MHPFVELAVSCAALHAFVRVTVACVNSCLITGWARHVCGHAWLPGGGRERGRRVTCRVGSVGLLAEVHGRLCTLYSAQCLVLYTRPGREGQPAWYLRVRVPSVGEQEASFGLGRASHLNKLPLPMAHWLFVWAWYTCG